MMKCFGSLCLSIVLGAAISMPAFGDAVLFYDFNDASDANTAKDITGNGNDGEVIDAEYSGDGGGRTGDAGDRAMDFGDFNNDAYVDIVTAEDGAFESLTENDMATLTMWIYGNDEQPVDQWTFYAGPYRQLGSHIPWSNSNVYFDVAGTEDSPCCDDRINIGIDLETFSEEWNHYAFVKSEDETAIYQNGELLLEGFDMRPLNEITEFFVGVGPEEDRRSYAGLIDDFGVFNTALSEEEIIDVMMNGIDVGPSVVGDFNGSGERDPEDFDLLAMGVMNGDDSFDLNDDGVADAEDRRVWVEDLSNTYFGDSNWDGEFSSADFVTVFTSAKYETGNEAGWAEGDWNGDKLFNSSDFVTAFTGGGYENGAREGGLMVVPEPSYLPLLLLGMMSVTFMSRRRN